MKKIKAYKNTFTTNKFRLKTFKSNKFQGRAAYSHLGQYSVSQGRQTDANKEDMGVKLFFHVVSPQICCLRLRK